MTDRVIIFDTTLRDGEQSPGCSMNLDEKLRLAGQLETLGVDVIEAGFPIASQDDFAAVREVSRRCKGGTVAALSRALPGDIERAWEALKEAVRPRIHTFLATSDIHLQYKLKLTREQALDQIRLAVKLAAGFTEDVEFSPEDSTRTDRDFLCWAVETAIEAGATTINIPDTVGYSVPNEYASIIAMLKNRVPNIDRVTLSVHCHNDLGLAVANSLAAISEGARQIECTINGIGERAGNAALEEVVMALSVRRDVLGYSTGVKTEELFSTSQLLSSITGVHVQPNKAIVGRNAFAHEAGIHQHGVIANSLTYEIMRPEMVGARPSLLVLGKHSGRHALRKRLEELGYSVSAEHLDRVYQLVTSLADTKKEISDDDLVEILRQGAGKAVEAYRLVSIEVIAGNSKTSWATISLEREGEAVSRAAEGPDLIGSVAAGIDSLTGLNGRLLDYSVRTATSAGQRLCDARVQVQFGASAFSGRSVSQDVIESTARAYLEAANKALLVGGRQGIQPGPSDAAFQGAAD